MCVTPSARADPIEANRAAPHATAPRAGDGRWTLIPGVEIAIAKPIRTAATLFSTATDLGLSASLARGSRWRLSLSLWYRRTLDPSPADGVSFFGGWVHPEVTFLGRIVGSVGVGWQLRHIDIEGASTTHGSLSAMGSVGVRFRPRSRVELTALARYDFSQPVAGEEFHAEYLSIALAVGLVPR